MSNKTLILSVLGILILFFAGIFVYNRTQNQEPDKYAENQEVKNNTQQPEEQQPTPTSTQTQEESVAQNQCSRNFDANKLKANNVNIKNRTVEISVKDFGKITLNFFDQDAPKTVENFLRLVDSGYYDCITIHRVAKGFVIQGGDPSGTGSGGDSAFGGEFADEIKADSALYKAGYKHGILAMANRGPNTNTSQFFIMLGDVQLPPAYTIFGKVVSGLDIVDKIGQVEIIPQMGPEDGKPKTPVVMETVKIVK